VRDQGFIVWVVLGAALLAVLNLPESVTQHMKAVFREGLAPLQGAISSVSRKSQESIEAIRGIGGLVTENQKMAAELVRLRNEVRLLKTYETENIALRQQLDFDQRSARDLIPAEIITRDVSGWWQTVRLGKGATDGVTANLAVVTSDGLVGKTVAASPRTADVLLISDPTCKVSAQISRTGLYGIVSGKGRTRKGEVFCEMNFINKDKPVKVGDEAVTSGLGGIFPRGLLIGYVDSVELDPSGLYQKALIIPKADLGALDYVFVVAEESDPVDELLQSQGVAEGSAP